MEKVETMTVKETAEALGKGDYFIRHGLRQGQLPFGTAVQNENGRWNYLIIKKKFYEYVGKNNEEEEG